MLGIEINGSYKQLPNVALAAAATFANILVLGHLLQQITADHHGRHVDFKNHVSIFISRLDAFACHQIGDLPGIFVFEGSRECMFPRETDLPQLPLMTDAVEVILRRQTLMVWITCLTFETAPAVLLPFALAQLL